MIMDMTTENVISGDYPDEPLPHAVARRLRGQLAEYRMTLEELGRVLGLSKMAASRRVNGETPISLAELELIDAATPITAAYLLTGHHPMSNPRPPEPPANPFPRPQTAGAVARIRRLRAADPVTGGRAARDLVSVQADSEVDDAALAYIGLASDQPSGCLADAA